MFPLYQIVISVDVGALGRNMICPVPPDVKGETGASRTQNVNERSMGFR